MVSKSEQKSWDNARKAIISALSTIAIRMDEVPSALRFHEKAKQLGWSLKYKVQTGVTEYKLLAFHNQIGNFDPKEGA